MLVESLEEALVFAGAVQTNLPKMEHPLKHSLVMLLSKMEESGDLELYTEYLAHSAECQLLQKQIDQMKSLPLPDFDQVLLIISDLYELELRSKKYDYPTVVERMLNRYDELLLDSWYNCFRFSCNQFSVNLPVWWHSSQTLVMAYEH